MSILKYIVFALVVFALWVTEPMWRNPDTPTSIPSVDEPIEPIGEEKKVKDAGIIVEKIKNEEVNVEERFLKKLEIKIGPKPSVKDTTGVPSSIYKYWRNTLEYPDSLQEETCSPIRGSEEGWATVCRYRAENSSGTLELREDRFVIRNGTAYRK